MSFARSVSFAIGRCVELCRFRVLTGAAQGILRGDWRSVSSALREHFRQEPTASPPAPSARIFRLAPGAVSLSEPSSPVTVVVPVYDAASFLEPLLRGLKAGTRIPHRLIVIDDASPDPRVGEFLANFAAHYDSMEVWTNPENLGFVATVNRGLESSTGHAVILNTDVEVPVGWLERLLAPLEREDRVASVTPFTNAGSYASFPRFFQDNPLPEHYTLEEVDRLFQLAGPRCWEIPTGVGFCMALHRDALSDVGLFDADTYGRGFCEEADWSASARDAGYRHLLTSDLFVYHKHGGSFESEERDRLKEKNLRTFQSRHPKLAAEIHKFILADPQRSFREFMTLLLDLSESDRIVLNVDRDAEGAPTDRGSRPEDSEDVGALHLLLTRDSARGVTLLRQIYRGKERVFAVENFRDLEILWQHFPPSKILAGALDLSPGQPIREDQLEWWRRRSDRKFAEKP